MVAATVLTSAVFAGEEVRGPASTTTAVNISPGVMDLVKMSDAGMDSAVIKSFVENSSTGYSLKTDEIIYLHNHGIPDSIITTMIQRGGELRAQTAPAKAVNPAPQTASTAYVYSGNPSYVYTSPSSYVGYPAYSYCYPGSYYYGSPYYWPPVGFSFSFGSSGYHSHYGGGGSYGGGGIHVNHGGGGGMHHGH